MTIRLPLLLPFLYHHNTRRFLTLSLKQSTNHLNHQLLEPVIMGLGEDIKEFGEGEMQQQGGSNGNDNSNNFSDGISDSTKDTMTDSAVDSFASKEGVPSQLDSGINNVVNDEVNKF
ncbi:uncharacterized protein EAE97_011662 [Botrytis byssoidea]|uniref:Uncharacterized protein n=1 Tax=Botrytis byssoidea TaxID=139641 RepID=A0A9P5HPW5_9HELO|nr:uncharacterized protein EAE97_011662 [Botrytis byssoidea]KAF7919330.1 hypothetical protein EAE97_011662 [Botrytis byssoidea]